MKVLDRLMVIPVVAALAVYAGLGTAQAQAQAQATTPWPASVSEAGPFPFAELGGKARVAGRRGDTMEERVAERTPWPTSVSEAGPFPFAVGEAAVPQGVGVAGRPGDTMEGIVEGPAGISGAWTVTVPSGGGQIDD